LVSKVGGLVSYPLDEFSVNGKAELEMFDLKDWLDFKDER